MKKPIKTKFSPMLAHVVAKETIEYGLSTFIQPKLDGIRCYITKDGAFSRNHNRFYNLQHIVDELKPVFDYAPELIFDGEIYNHDLKDDFNKIISLARLQNLTPEKAYESRMLLEFHCYDCVDVRRPELSYLERNDIIRHVVEYKYKLNYTKTVVTRAVNTHEIALEIHRENKRKGYEGSIIRNNNSYECKRSKNLIKFKDFADAEARVIGWVEGLGKRDGTIGKFLCEDSEGQRFGVPVMESYGIMREMFDIAEWYVGKDITFTYFQRTKSGSYRHPLFKAVRNYE